MIRKSDAALSKEFQEKYRKVPNKNELLQYRKWIESFSLDGWMQTIKDLKKRRKDENNAKRKNSQ